VHADSLAQAAGGERRDDEVPPTTYLVEGNIGAGKSTLCRTLSRALGATSVYELIGKRFLTAFYERPSTYAFALQMVQQAKRAAVVMHTNSVATADTPITILDRSVVGDYAFALWNWASGNMSDQDWQLYREQAGADVAAALDSAGAALRHTTIIFLNDDARSCHVRQTRRDQGTPTIEYPYLAGLHATHLICMACIPPTYTIVELHWAEYAELAQSATSDDGERPSERLDEVYRVLRSTPDVQSARRATLAVRARRACDELTNIGAAERLSQFLKTALRM